MTIRKETLQVESLVQFQHLHTSEPISDPENIPRDYLKFWWRETKKVCLQHNFGALAFNQLPQEFRQVLGFGDINPSVMIISKSEDIAYEPLADCILINPCIHKQRGIQASFEGCGSIKDYDGRIINMVIKRPYQITGSAFVWHLDYKKPIYQKFTVQNTIAAFISHEVDHLLGGSALSKPENMMDIRNQDVVSAILNNLSENSLIYRLLNYGTLVYDANLGKILKLYYSDRNNSEYLDVTKPSRMEYFPVTYQ